MASSTRRIVLACLLAFACTASTAAFVPSARSKISPRSTNLQVVPNPADFGDLSALHNVAQDFLSSSSTLLSDAAAAAADAEEKSPGWWANYLQIFRNILVFVHTTIDQPLKNAGIENTWGISIAVFTCSKYKFYSAPLFVLTTLKPYSNSFFLTL